MTTLGILILAGGRSSRMGQDKASLVLEGQPMLARICQRVAGPNTQVVVVARAQQVLPDLAPEVVRVDDDAQLAGNGPLTALGTGLRWFVAKKIEYVCFLACDMPDASRANLVYLVERLRNSEAEAIWTCDDAGRGQPGRGDAGSGRRGQEAGGEAAEARRRRADAGAGHRR